MTKKIKNIIIAAIFILLFAFAAIWIMWGKNITKSQLSATELKISDEKYTVAFIDVPDGIIGGNRFYFISGDKWVHVNVVNNNNTEYSTSLTEYDLKTREFQKKELDFSGVCDGNMVVIGACSYTDNNYLLLAFNRQGDIGQDGDAYFIVVNSDAEIIRSSKIEYEDLICQIAADASGNVVLVGKRDGTANVYDSNFKLVMTEQSPSGEMYDYVASTEGKLQVVYPGGTDGSHYFGIYDAENKKFEYQTVSINICGIETTDSKTGDVVYVDGNGKLCQYSFGNSYSTVIINTTENDVATKAFYPPCIYEGEYIIPILETSENNTTIIKLAVISK